MQRRQFLSLASLGVAGCASTPIQQPASRAGGEGGALTRIGFASCFDQTNKNQPVWDAAIADRPDLFLFGGDNVYCEMPYSLARLKRAYAQAAESEGLARLRRSVPHLAIWDDNDYGANDGGAEFAGKAESKAEFLDFWKVPANDPRRQREGLYHAQVFGPAGRRVQVILLDARWFRSPWKRTDQRDAPGKERYVPDADPSLTMLGEAQWRWLAEQLAQPAEVRLVVSGIQVVTEGHGWERWGNFPAQRQRLYQLIGQTHAQGVVFLSGDRHIGALYREANGTPYPLYEMTSSGLTHTWRTANEAGPNRLGAMYTDLHFGSVDVDWAARSLRLAIKDTQGAVQRTRTIELNELKAAS